MVGRAQSSMFSPHQPTKMIRGSYKVFRIHCTLGCPLFAIKSYKCVMFPMAFTCLATQPLLNKLFLQWHHTKSVAACYESSVAFLKQKCGGKLLTLLGLWTFLLPGRALGNSVERVSRALHSPAASHCFYTGHAGWQTGNPDCLWV